MRSLALRTKSKIEMVNAPQPKTVDVQLRSYTAEVGQSLKKIEEREKSRAML